MAEYARIVSSSLDLAAFPLALGLRKILPTRETLRREELKFGSSGRIQTYDQSVNPDWVGTLPLRYSSNPSRRVRIRRADFHALISLSRALAVARVLCGSDHTRDQRPFLRVNLPAVLSVRL